MEKIKVAIVGASGYTGLELIKILLNHPNFIINELYSTEGGGDISEIYPSLKDVFEKEIKKAKIPEIAKNDLVFLAVPHKTAMNYVKDLMQYDCKIVDFSADYRLKQNNYEDYYCPHIDPANIENAGYGIPEIFRDFIKGKKLIANPGCYPTATILISYLISSFT